MRYKSGHITSVLIPVIFFLLLFVTPSYAGNKSAYPARAFITQVDVYKVASPKDIPINLVYPARLISKRDVVVVARVSGVLERKFFTEGHYVKKGQLLYKIEPDVYKARLDEARAEFLLALAQFEKAKRDWIRANRSFKDHVISVQERDSAKYAYEMARANLLAKKAILEEAKINLGYTNVRATISGVTGLKKVDVGDFVLPNTPLIEIKTLNPIYVEFSIPDSDVIKYKFFQYRKSYIKSIKLRLNISGKEYPLLGRLNFIGTSLNKDTATLKMRGVFPNPKHILIPNEFVRVKLIGLFKRHVLVIPQRALLQNPYGTMVFIIKNGKAYAKKVQIGGETGKFFIVKSGLKPGDMIAVDNFFRLRNNMPVKIGKIIGDKE